MDVDRVAELQRWEDAGALWRVLSRASGALTVVLLTCDGGEEMGRFTTDDPRLLGYVGDRDGSDQ
ncbi:hypothetical protein [Mycolicibacterium hippocampi]|uniref:hypothetical protein n=1 Tax=Mycolicibacterium hippocampi TaxID=659824 RepID=UPI003512495C